MISKFGKVQNSWFMKAILTLTALSFMSLFGIAGWLSAPKNKPVIKVDDFVIYQNEIAIQFEQEQRIAKNVFGDSFELSEPIKEMMLQSIVQRELENTIIKRTAQKYNIYVGDDLIRQIIFSQAEFMDSNGRFNIEKLRRILSMSGWTEDRYINTLRRDIIKQNLINFPLENVNAPAVMVEKMAKLENQRKVFKYIKVDPATVKVDRKITNEELEQYYQDFSINFMVPEKRDVSFVVVESSDIEKSITPLDEEVDEYYQDNINQFETPETRSVLQIIVDNEEKAKNIVKDLNNGKDFLTVASSAGQDIEDTVLGEVSKDTLIADIADEVFDAKKNNIVGPVYSELGWHVLKVTKIKPATKMNKSEAKAKIIAAIRSERAYDEAYEVARNIDDQVGAGAKIADIAKNMKLKVYTVKGLTEDGNAKTIPSIYRDLVKSNDFIDSAFSYNIGEVSQVVDFDNGFLIVEVNEIVDVHSKSLEQVKGEIEKMWIENEKSSIAQEITNDVMADLEFGESLDDIAKRFGLSLKTTKPMKRSETFENLSTNDVLDLFHSEIGKPRAMTVDAATVIAVPTKVIENQRALTEDEIDGVKQALKNDLTTTYRATLLNSFADSYDVRVKYRLIGLSNGL